MRVQTKTWNQEVGQGDGGVGLRLYGSRRMIMLMRPLFACITSEQMTELLKVLACESCSFMLISRLIAFRSVHWNGYRFFILPLNIRHAGGGNVLLARMTCRPPSPPPLENRMIRKWWISVDYPQIIHWMDICGLSMNLHSCGFSHLNWLRMLKKNWWDRSS